MGLSLHDDPNAVAGKTASNLAQINSTGSQYIFHQHVLKGKVNANFTEEYATWSSKNYFIY